MKKLLIFFLALLCLSYIASATLSLSASPTTISFGEIKRNSTSTAAFTITNTGSEGLTNVTPISNAAAKYNIAFNKTGFNMAAGSSESLSVNATIPIDEPTTNHSIGSIIINSNELNATLIGMNVNVKGGLTIEEFNVRVYYRDGDTDINQNINEGHKLDFEDDVRPGSQLKFDIDVGNAFTSSEEIDIEDITVTVTILEIDDGEDLDEESDEFDLEPNEEERVTLLFDIPLEVEEGDYDILVEIEGEDKEGTLHTIERNLEMQLSKERRDIIIRKADLTQNTLSCERETRLNIDILNVGSKEETDVKVEAVNNDIGLDFVDDDVELSTDPFDDDDEYTKSLIVKASENLSSGTYPIKVNVYLSGGAVFATKTADLIVKDCGTPKEPVKEEKEEEAIPVVNEPKTEEEEREAINVPVVEEKVTETKEAPSKKPIVALIVTGILAVGVGAFIAGKLMPKKEV